MWEAAKDRDAYKFYDLYYRGWNDFIDGKEWPGSSNSTEDYRNGWHDAREYKQTHGKMPDKIES